MLCLQAEYGSTAAMYRDLLLQSLHPARWCSSQDLPQQLLMVAVIRKLMQHVWNLTSNAGCSSKKMWLH